MNKVRQLTPEGVKVCYRFLRAYGITDAAARTDYFVNCRFLFCTIPRQRRTAENARA